MAGQIVPLSLTGYTTARGGENPESKDMAEGLVLDRSECDQGRQYFRCIDQ
jgi:hypothetical protein